MKIFLLGNGKLGRLVAHEARARGHEIVGVGTSQSIPWEKMPSSDACIDCTMAEAFKANLQGILLSHKPLVVATTGIEDCFDLLKKHFQERGCLVSPNFSLGFGTFYHIVKRAAELSRAFDVAGVEHHHNKKRDAPSGSAKELQKLFAKEVPFSSVRVGSCPGTHTLYFDGEDDTIALTHQAKGREGFAKGAVAALEWIVGKKGFFTMEDFLNDQCSS